MKSQKNHHTDCPVGQQHSQLEPQPRPSRSTVTVGSSLLLWLLICLPTLQAFQAEGAEEAADRQYTYSWMFSDASEMKPRGGTTSGPEVKLDKRVSPLFRALQEPDLTPRERDRRAILAMAGDYRTSFDFIETVGFTPDYEPRAPYQSWGTERVYVVADEPDFVSLQHIIVMHFAMPDGAVSEPMVVKHWRHDWRYEDREVHGFVGSKQWKRERLSPEEVQGSWTQTVYQVDDSPRYEAFGRWEHSPGVSIWESSAMRRPLPRREFSVRDDYDTLYGTHRITITPSGWTQEEDALKLVLDEQNAPDSDMPYLAREAGLSRYDRVVEYDFSAGDEYWAATGAFWARVRDFWGQLYAQEEAFALRSIEGSPPMFAQLFALAERQDLDEAAQRQAIQDTMDTFVERRPD